MTTGRIITNIGIALTVLAAVWFLLAWNGRPQLVPALLSIGGVLVALFGLRVTRRQLAQDKEARP